MKLLDACLALALTLALFASTVTILVEILHRGFGQRGRDLRGFLAALFDRSLAHRLGTDSAAVAALRADFVTKLSTDHTLTAVLQNNGRLLKHVPTRIGSETAVRFEDVLYRLRHTHLYEQIAAWESAHVKETLGDMAQSFERLEQAVTKLFATRAKMVSYAVGILLALMVNIDAVWLLENFVGNSELTRETISRFDGDAKARTNDKSGSTGADSEAGIRQMRLEMQMRQAAAFPVGWAFFPYCVPPDRTNGVDPRCAFGTGRPPEQASGWDGIDVVRRYGSWFLCVIVTGLLIGLGGPYWFDLAASLARLRDGIKGGAAPADKLAPEADTKQLIESFADRIGGEWNKPDRP